MKIIFGIIIGVGLQIAAVETGHGHWYKGVARQVGHSLVQAGSEGERGEAK